MDEEIRDEVHKECQEEENETESKEAVPVCTADDGLLDLNGNCCCYGTRRREEGSWGGEAVASHHEDNHGLSNDPAKPQHDRCSDTVVCCREYNPSNGRPACRAEGKTRLPITPRYA